MSASTTSTTLALKGGSQEPFAARILGIATVTVLVALLSWNGRVIGQTLADHWPELAFWAALTIALQFLPVAVEDFSLTVDLPVILAVAFLYPPPVAAAVALFATVDPQEFLSPRISFSRALFNRAQISLSVFGAGTVFAAIGGLENLATGLVATSLAVGCDYLINFAFVSVYVSLRRGIGWRSAVAKLYVGRRPQHFILTYCGYGAMALVIAHLWQDVGAWSVAAFIVPTILARQALARAQELHLLAERLRKQERLLERSLDRITDERRDERLRIAGDLHDDSLQALVKAWLLGKVIEKESRALGPLAPDVEELVRTVDFSIDSLREVIHDLRVSPLGRSGLVPSLRSFVKDCRLDWRLPVTLEADELPSLEPQLQVALYQIAREGVTNASQHSSCSRVVITLQSEGGSVEIGIEDDGVGFDPESVKEDEHFGLGLMRERVARVGGTLAIATEIGKGTRLMVSVPIEPRPDSSD